jgi:hypothetical protein
MGPAETTTVVPPLKTSPMAVPAKAMWLDGPTDESRGPIKAGIPSNAGRGTETGVSALAWATGAAIASAAMAPVARATDLRIGLRRLVMAKVLLLVVVLGVRCAGAGRC